MSVYSVYSEASDERRRGGRARASKYGPRPLAFVLVAAAVVLAACSSPASSSGGTSSPTVASLGSSGSLGSSSQGGGGSQPKSGGSSTTTLPKGGDATRLVDEWASCMRRHGDPNQVDPTIDIHGVINIMIGAGASQALANEVKGGVDQQTGQCSQYLSAAQRVLREQFPVSPPPDNSALLNYAECMRANGVPGYPDPSGERTDLRGIDTNSPTFIKANDTCGKQIDAPAWWIDGWGPPGDVSVRSCVDGSQTVACPSSFSPGGGGQPSSGPGSNG
jgi:hypothetical protein